MADLFSTTSLGGGKGGGQQLNNLKGNNVKLNTNIVIQYGARNRKLRKNGFSSYQKYLKSDQWKSVKLKWQKKRAQKSIYWSKCNCCGTNENLILHHLRYGKIGSSCKLVGSSCKLGGIVPVCMRCHNEMS